MWVQRIMYYMVSRSDKSYRNSAMRLSVTLLWTLIFLRDCPKFLGLNDYIEILQERLVVTVESNTVSTNECVTLDVT